MTIIKMMFLVLDNFFHKNIYITGGGGKVTSLQNNEI